MKLEFATAPSLWSMYPKVLTARKPSLLRDGQTVPRIEAEWNRVRIRSQHLCNYRELCGETNDARLPIAYPHVLASPFHLAVLANDAFPLKLLGLVHVRNRIVQHRALDTDVGGRMRVAIEGHADTERGQEFTLCTFWDDANGDTVWEEECVFLARRKREGGGDARAETAAATARAGARTTSFRAPAGLGRSYGLLAGDLNPIHLSDASAKLFGFKGAIAHGMWSLARCAADLDDTVLSGACEYQVAFKLPVFMPAWVMLEQWDAGAATEFCLRDNQGEKPHLTGRLQRRA